MKSWRKIESSSFGEMRVWKTIEVKNCLHILLYLAYQDSYAIFKTCDSLHNFKLKPTIDWGTALWNSTGNFGETRVQIATSSQNWGKFFPLSTE